MIYLKVDLTDKEFKAAIIKKEKALQQLNTIFLKQMKTIESLSKEMETLSKDTEDIKKNPVDILELKITFKN